MGTPNVKRLTVAISLRLPVALLEGLNVAAKKRDAPLGEAMVNAARSNTCSRSFPAIWWGQFARERCALSWGHALRQRRHDVIAADDLGHGLSPISFITSRRGAAPSRPRPLTS